MDNDDLLIGRMLSRKQMLRLLGGAGVAVLAAGCGSGGSDSTSSGAASTSTAAAGTSSSLATASPLSFSSPSPLASPVASPIPNVVITPALTEGPFVDENLNRSNLLGDTTRASVVNGLPLQLSFRVQQVSGSTVTPFAGAQVDIWHADAAGTYSDENNAGIQPENTVGQNWLRGYQITDANGLVSFTTIYPGWYQGRTIHLHVKVRSGAFVTNTQLFFDDTFSDTIMANAPYNTRGSRQTRNNADGIYMTPVGNATAGLLLTLNPTTAGNGLAASFTFGLQM